MPRRLRLPRSVEKEAAKLLSTLGFKDYAEPLWNLARAQPRTQPASLPVDLARQLFDQAERDPAILAAGPKAVPNLPQSKRNLKATRGVSGSDLLAGVGVPPAALLIAGRLDLPSIESLEMLVAGLRRAGARTFVVIVTDDGRHASRADRLEGIGDVHLIFWRDRLPSSSAEEARLLASVLHTVGAPVIIALQAPLGFETLAGFGRALTSSHRLYAYFAGRSGIEQDIHDLRSLSPHATIVAPSADHAARLRHHARGLQGPGIVALTSDFAAVFGTSFEDLRAPASRTVTEYLLGRRGSPPPVQLAHDTAAREVDVTVTIVFHRERELAVPALASLADMIQVARRHGIRVEARAMLDTPDEMTRDLVVRYGAFLDDVRVVAVASAANTRNAGIELARGAFLLFLDGDDLWGADLLWLSYRAATQSPAASTSIWHAEAQFCFWASDCRRASETELPHEAAHSSFLFMASSDAPDFDPCDVLIDNQWNVTSLASREIFLRFPYRPDEWSRQIGIEDWRWNLETLGHGIAHLIVPSTIHLIRIKESGSLGQRHNAYGLLPLLASPSP